LSGIVLAVGRIAEDTAVILMTGVVASAGLPAGLTDHYEALPFSIYYLTAEHRNTVELNLAFGAAVVLLCLTTFLLILASSVFQLSKRGRQSNSASFR
jgi:phosphate transport system permease protein